MIHFKNKKTISVTSNLNMYQTLTDAIANIFDFGENDSENESVFFEDLNGCEIIVNLNNTSMIELPLMTVENVICKKMEELFEDL